MNAFYFFSSAILPFHLRLDLPSGPFKCPMWLRQAKHLVAEWKKGSERPNEGKLFEICPEDGGSRFLLHDIKPPED
jgi:hypothetical protein